MIIDIPLLSSVTEVPAEYIALVAKFAPADFIVFEEIVLPSLPVIVPVENEIVPEAAPVPDPSIVQLVIVLLLASAINCMVEAVAAVFVFLMVSELPPIFNPLIIILSAPFRFIRGPATEPVKDDATPSSGLIVSE